MGIFVLVEENILTMNLYSGMSRVIFRELLHKGIPVKKKISE